MKSYGRAPTFLMLTGYEQVRSVVAALAGDWEAARRVELVLPETGVCNGPAAPAPAVAGACCGSGSSHEALQPSSPSRASTRRAISSRVTRTSARAAGPSVGELPVEVALARDVRAGVAAAHRHDDVGRSASSGVSGCGRRPARSMPSSRMTSTTSGCTWPAGSATLPADVGAVAAGGRALEQRLAHLRAARVVQADEQHVAHRAEAYSIDKRHFNR